ncbi:MAG: MarR family winged helix-turn-helix transcriptional regulator [Acidimicrobiales bacterium]
MSCGSPDALESQLGDQAETLFRAFRVIRRRILGRPLGMQSLPPSYLELLAATRREPGLRVRHAAAMLYLASNTVSTMAGKLDDAGLLQRRRDGEDGRGVRLHLTLSAERQLSAWRDQRLDVLASALAELSPADRSHITDALPALHRLTAAIVQHTQTPRSGPIATP